MPESVADPAPAASTADFELGRNALLDITPAETIGEPVGSVDEGDGVVSVYFDTIMAGYKGWRWTVSIAHVDGIEPSVLETEMTPGETALLSPAWVPWADRLADYKAGQGEQPSDGSDDDSDDSDDDDDDDDDDDFDDDDVNDNDDALLHSGDLDGVDIDSLEDDDSDDGDESDDDDEESDDDDDDDDDDDEDEDDDDVNDSDEDDSDDESAPESHVDEPEEAEREPDDAGPKKTRVSRSKKKNGD